MNGDGWPDVGASSFAGSPLAYAVVVSGPDAQPLYPNPVENGYLAGQTLCAAGDINGDGHADVLMGLQQVTVKTHVRLWSGCDVEGTSYCGPAVANSSGLPAVLDTCGSCDPDEQYFMLNARQMPVGKFGYFLTSQTQGFVQQPGGSQGNLCLGGQIVRFVNDLRLVDAGGRFSLRLYAYAQAGETWNFQAWFRDVNPGNTSNFTQGMQVTFQ